MQRIKDLILSRIRMSRTSSGFTLIELLVVIAVIGILVSIISFSFTTAQRQSRDSRRRQDIQQIQNAFEQYYTEYTVYPINDTDINTAFDGSRPKDPKDSGDYVYTWDTADDQYCVCAFFETASGNAGLPGGATCTFSDGGEYYCAQNQQ